MHKLTVLELCGIDSLPVALHFLPRVASVQNCEQVGANPLMSKAAGSCLPSTLVCHELLSVILHCILLKSAFWSSSVALNCAPPNMLDVWPDLQAKGVRQIKKITLLKIPFSLLTTTVRRHVGECNPFCSVIYCIYRCCTHTTLAYL